MYDKSASKVNENNFGLSGRASVQFALSWVAPLYLDTIDQYSMITARPKIRFETLGSLQWTFHLNFVELTYDFVLFPWQFTPIDLLLRVDALHPERHCSGISYNMRTFLLDLLV